MIKKNKAQSAFEFLIMAGFVLFVFSGFFILIQGNIYRKMMEKKEIEFKEVALMVQDEINLATDASEGYMREFKLPAKISGTEYEINLTDDLVYIYTVDYKLAMAFPVKNIIGNVSKGLNIIKKENGKVIINSFLIVYSSSFLNRGNISKNNIDSACVGTGGQNKNPQLTFYNAPPQTVSYAIIMEDLDRSGYTHWVLYNIKDTKMNEGSVPVGAIFGRNDNAGSETYLGPCPPSGERVHRYFIHVYALKIDITDTVPQHLDKAGLEGKMAGNILDKADYIGTYIR